MPSGITFDVVLIAFIVALAAWEGVVAVRRHEKRRMTVVALALLSAAVLLYLRWPQIFASGR